MTLTQFPLSTGNPLCFHIYEDYLGLLRCAKCSKEITYKMWADSTNAYAMEMNA